MITTPCDIPSDIWPQIITIYCIAHGDIRFLSSVCKLFAKAVDITYYTVLQSGFSNTPNEIIGNLKKLMSVDCDGERVITIRHDSIPLSFNLHSVYIPHARGLRLLLCSELYIALYGFTTILYSYDDHLGGVTECPRPRTFADMKIREFIRKYLPEVTLPLPTLDIY